MSSGISCSARKLARTSRVKKERKINYSDRERGGGGEWLLGPRTTSFWTGGVFWEGGKDIVLLCANALHYRSH